MICPNGNVLKLEMNCRPKMKVCNKTDILTPTVRTYLMCTAEDEVGLG